MTVHRYTRKALLQLMHQQAQNFALFRRAGVGMIALLVLTADVANADALSIPTLAVRTHHVERAPRLNRAVGKYYIVITHIVPPLFAVPTANVVNVMPRRYL